MSCVQIVQAFSRLVAAGDDWASATEVVLLAAVALQHDPQADSHAMVMANFFVYSLSGKNDAFPPCIACLSVHTADCMLTLAKAFQVYHVIDNTFCAESQLQSKRIRWLGHTFRMLI